MSAGIAVQRDGVRAVVHAVRRDGMNFIRYEYTVGDQELTVEVPFNVAVETCKFVLDLIDAHARPERPVPITIVVGKPK